tara:strand:+ start:11800 stop:13551 length:1752 start_codon:yes stop_codon:yes gene_type:complete
MLTNTQKNEIEVIYQNAMGRPADAAGLAGYTAVLAGGGSMDDVRTDVQNSPEAAGRRAQIKSQADNTARGAADMMEASVTNPGSLVTTADVAAIDANATGTNIKDGTGQIGDPSKVIAPKPFKAATVDPAVAAAKVEASLAGLEAEQGTVSDDAVVQTATTDPTELAQLGLETAQIEQAQTVAPTTARTLQAGEAISGSAVDMAAVEEALDIQAAQADPSAQATVRGQMGELMQDFQGTSPPAWAAGALRNATAAMAARGLGASSLAGQALVQAAMEAALPIAAADASTFAKFESQNLSNRQQTAMFAAEQRANFLGMEFTQNFQTRVANAAKISDIANMNFTAEQQIALENARLAQSVDLANLSAASAMVLSDAAAMSNIDMANLNNRQQSAVINAQSFLAMDMKNMDLAQQTEMFKSQMKIQSIFGDQSAINASAQFNAASENQTGQFFASMSSQVQQFNAGMDIQTDQFNAKNGLIIAQANAQWRQNASTINTAAQNEANRNAALATNGMTQSAMDQIWQRERDIMDQAFRQSESAEDRSMSVFLAGKSEAIQKELAANKAKGESDAAKGYLLTRLLFGK